MLEKITLDFYGILFTNFLLHSIFVLIAFLNFV